MRRTLRLIGVVFVLASVGGAVALLRPTAAQAAPITVNGCGPSSGSTDTGGVTVTLDDVVLAGDTMVPLHGNTGAGTFPAVTDNGMASPLCGLKRQPDGTLRHEWLYCTDPTLNTCPTEAFVRKGNAATGVAAFSDLDRARLVYAVDNLIDNATSATRILSQRLVWCITERIAAGASAPEYYRNGTDVPLACPNWPAIDPTLVVAPSVAISAPAAPAPTAGTVAQFALTTNVSPLTIASTGLDSLALCPGVAGATMAGNVLTIAAPSAAAPIALCATRATEGAGSITATATQPNGRTLEFWQRPDNVQFCQGMLSTETLATNVVSAQASAAWVAAQTPTTTTVAPTTTVAISPTTTTDPGVTTTTVLIGGGTTTAPPSVLETTIPRAAGTLPRTGASQASDGAYWALVLLLFGVGLVAIGRRPSHQPSDR